MKAPSLAFAACVLVAACTAAPVVPRCHRYDVAALLPENGFAASVEWDSALLVDTAPERIDLALSVVPPVRGTIDLVHVFGDRKAESWELSPGDSDKIYARCWITPAASGTSCQAIIQTVPHRPGGYYYLRTNGNAVLEAGLAFYLCD